MNYVGIDHYRQYSHMTLMGQEGRVLRFGRVPNLRSEIERLLEGGEAMDKEWNFRQNRKHMRRMRVAHFREAAVMDRITHNAFRLELQGESMRKRRSPLPHSGHMDVE